MSQAVSMDAGSYDISFDAAQRGNWQSQAQQIEVLVNGTVVATVTPASMSYDSHSTGNFTVAAGTHTIEFLGLAPATADSTAFIDLVSLTPAMI